MHSLFVRCAAILGCGFASICIAAPQYRATVLHPSGMNFSSAAAIEGDYQFGFGNFVNQNVHALMWQGTAESVVDLNPPGYVASQITGATFDSQLGSAAIQVGNDLIWRAQLWKGSAASAVDLHPDGFEYTGLTDAFEHVQVGSGYGPATSNRFNALLWEGTRESIVNLHPAGFMESFATGAEGEIQVGSARMMIGGPTHALLWRGTAESFVDLHPASYATSHAWGIAGDIVAGSAVDPLTNEEHALLWKLADGATVDLNPSDFKGSEIRAIAGGFQAGFAWRADGPNRSHAMVWTGTAESAFDLHPSLGGRMEYVRSGAVGVSVNGDVSGWAETASGEFHAMMWSVVPEPAAGQLLVFAVILGSLGLRRR